jgi:hypothetical protein
MRVVLMGHVRLVSTGLAVIAAVMLVGCSEGASGDKPVAGAGGAGGMTSGGAGGATGGVGGATAGTGGMNTTAGAGGSAGTMSGGTGGGSGAGGMAGGGAGGMTGGAGGMAGGGAGGMAGGGVPGCEAAVTGEPAALHAAALDAFTGGCGFDSCHNADGDRAMLVILETDNLNTLLVDRAACQVPALKLVASGGGQAALDGSWIWQKLAAPDDASMMIVPNDAWGEPATCGQTQGTFGTRMPMTGLDLSDNRMGAIRNWICAGAAGP